MVTRTTTTTTVVEKEDPTIPQEGDTPERQRARVKLALAQKELQEIEQKSVGDTLLDGTKICCSHQHKFTLNRRKRVVKRWDTFLADFAVVERPHQTGLLDDAEESESEEEEEGEDDRDPVVRTFHRSAPFSGNPRAGA